MAKGDKKVDAAADKLQDLADSAASKGGIKGKLAQPLADDAAFLRKLKPGLMAKRAKGDLPTNQRPNEGTVAPAGPQLDERPKPKGSPSGTSPYLVVGIALATGIVLAKALDWRSHAHPKR